LDIPFFIHVSASNARIVDFFRIKISKNYYLKY